MKQYIFIVVALIAGLVIGRFTTSEKVVVETVTECHTINTSAISPAIVSEPIGSRIERVRLVFVEQELGEIRQELDAICKDSATVELPIRDYTFTDDSTYTITARGVYVESLPQIQLYPKTTSTTRIESASAPKVTHSFQLGGGIAYTPKGFQPAVYFGYGLSIRF